MLSFNDGKRSSQSPKALRIYATQARQMIGNQAGSQTSPSQELFLQNDFPLQTPAPKYAIGDRVRLIPMPAEDYGIVTGFQYAPAEHLQDWAWCYTIWLDPQSPSRAWTPSDLAWEADLQRLTPNPIDVLTKEQSA